MIQNDSVPFERVNCSPELKNLISILLEKDPVKRARYSELVTHPFWQDSEDLKSMQ
jgi:serine/threonine protein kinase